MVAFLGTMVFPRRDKKISIRLSGIVVIMMKKKKSTILPMMLADIYCALTKCREGEDFFEGCSILLQMWFLEHLYRHRFAINFKSEWTNYILSHPNRMKELVDKLPKVRVKQARLEVERNYRSTLDILSNNLKNAREELAQRNAIFKERVRLIQKRNINPPFKLYMRIGHCHRRYGATRGGVRPV
ncbi:hypothetical protein H5410_039895 [Solanum commersonii]|uniref:Uncharacterized protein n=1 Tax=Solanum commersonii TaxID=4109 RepID=A0A9J5XNH2_SOLCO|nr:hypothetical protein H5410_039895 [Solanum commersonii]